MLPFIADSCESNLQALSFSSWFWSRNSFSSRIALSASSCLFSEFIFCSASLLMVKWSISSVSSFFLFSSSTSFLSLLFSTINSADSSPACLVNDELLLLGDFLDLLEMFWPFFNWNKPLQVCLTCQQIRSECSEPFPNFPPSFSHVPMKFSNNQFEPVTPQSIDPCLGCLFRKLEKVE